MEGSVVGYKLGRATIDRPYSRCENKEGGGGLWSGLKGAGGNRDSLLPASGLNILSQGEEPRPGVDQPEHGAPIDDQERPGPYRQSFALYRSPTSILSLT